MIGQRVDVAQRSDEWRQLRAGLLTGSRVGEIFATLKSGGEAAARRDLRLQLACERLTGQPADDRFITREMQRGIDREADAIAAYEAATGAIVEAIGFLRHDRLLTGCSPDGLVDGGGGVIEVKCPKSTTHLGYVCGRRVPPEHRAQVVHALWLTGAAWADFVSFDDRFPPPLRLFVARLDCKSVDLAAHELAVRLFLAELDTEIARLTALLPVAA